MNCEFQKGWGRNKIKQLPINVSNNNFGQPDMNAFRQEHFKRWHPMRRLVIHPPEKRKPANGKK